MRPDAGLNLRRRSAADALDSRRAGPSGAGAIAFTTFAAYLPVLGAGFIWDDDVYVTENPLLTAPDGLKRIWFSAHFQSQYFPLVYTVFRWQHALWGFHPAGYHLVNLLLHIANALLVWVVLRRLALPGAWFAAAIFALHPVQVESVAWVTELKNTQSTFFYLAALLAWLEEDVWSGLPPGVRGQAPTRDEQDELLGYDR